MQRIKKTRIITLTGRRPVEIEEIAWPVVAGTDWHSSAVECQANALRHIRVREHADGRRIVYGVHVRGRGGHPDGGMPEGFKGSRAGYVLVARQEGETKEDQELHTIVAIGHVADEIGAPDLAHDVIAALPAEVL